MEAWRRSGLSSREYARRNDLNPSTFSWWRGELRRERSQQPAMTLVPVTTATAPNQPRERLEVVLPRDIVVVVPDGADLGRVAELVRALVGAC